MTDTERDAELKRQMGLPPEAGKWYFEIVDSFRKFGSFDSEADAVDAGHLLAVALHRTGTLAVGQWEASVRAGKPTKWIVLAGYEGEHDMPPTWRVHARKTKGGMANQSDGDTRGKANRGKERLEGTTT